MLFKLSNMNSNLALTLGYLNPALNNSALIINITSPNTHQLRPFPQASEFNESEWESEGLFQPKPSYTDGKDDLKFCVETAHCLQDLKLELSLVVKSVKNLR